MKLTTSLAIVLLAAFSLSGQTGTPGGPQTPGNRVIQALDQQAAGFLNGARQRLGLTSDDGFERYFSFIDRRGVYHGKFQQTHKGVRVQGGSAIAHIGQGAPSLTSKVYGGINIPVTPAINRETAAETARKAFDPRGARRGVEVQEQFLVIVPELYTVDNGPLPRGAVNPDYRRYEKKVRSFRLVWEAAVDAEDISRLTSYHVDAQSGEIWKSYQNDVHEQVDGTARTWIHGELPITLTKTGSDYGLVDQTRGSSLVRNAAHGTSDSPSKSPLYMNKTGVFGNGILPGFADPTDSPTGETVGGQAYWDMQRVWDMYGKVFKWNGWDGAGRPFDIRMHFRKDGENYTDAHFHPSSIEGRRAVYFGEGPVNQLGFVAHELTHGVWYYSVDPGSKGQEARGINEGNADIAHALAEFHAYSMSTNGIRDIANEFNWYLRMVDPYTYPQGQRYYTGDHANDEEHGVGTILGHLFIALAHGASHDKDRPSNSVAFPHGLAGIGVPAAAELWFDAMTAYMPKEPDFYDVRAAYLAACNHTSVLEDAVRAAFASASVGEYDLTGKAAPKIDSLQIETVQEDRGYMTVLVRTSGDKRVGRIEFAINGQTEFVTSKTEQVLGWTQRRVNLRTWHLSPGTRDLKVTVTDAAGNQTSATRQFTISGEPRQLLKNPGFEEGCKDWVCVGSIVSADETLAHTGARYARMKGSHILEQTFTIPAPAKSAKLSYRVRVEGRVDSGFQNMKMRVQLRRDDDTLVRQLAQYEEQELTQASWESNSFILQSFDIPEKGQPLKISFRVEGPNNHRFKIDDVVLYYSEPKTVELSATARTAEQTLDLKAEVTGFAPNQIKRVEFLDGGTLIQSDSTAPYAVFPSTVNMAAGPRTITAKVIGANDQTLGTDSQQVTIQKPVQLLANGGFESGATGWTVQGTAKIEQDVMDDLIQPFRGSWYARMGGSGQSQHGLMLSPAFKVPLNAGPVKVSFRVSVKTGNPGTIDHLTVHLTGANKVPVKQLAFVTAAGSNQYAYFEVDLPKSDLDPSQNHIRFLVQEDGSIPTTFLIDEVHVAYQPLGLQF